MPSSLLDLVNTRLTTSLDWPSLMAIALTVVVALSVIASLYSVLSAVGTVPSVV